MPAIDLWARGAGLGAVAGKGVRGGAESGGGGVSGVGTGALHGSARLASHAAAHVMGSGTGSGAIHGAIGIPGIPVCGVPTLPICMPTGTGGGIGSGIAGGLANDVLGAMVQWVVDAATWLLGQIGSVLSATTSVDVGAAWFTSQYQVMVGIAAVMLLPMVLGAVIQSIYRQDAGPLVRMVLVQLPLAVLLTGVAVKIVQLSLSATDALCSTVSAGAGGNIDKVLTGLADGITAAGGSSVLPGMVLLVGAMLVVLASFLLWIELLVRDAAIYVALLFLPLVLASIVWPAVSHWCRRLVETLAALILSKFVIVAVLSLAVGAVSSGTTGTGGNDAGFASVLAGGALLLLAAFTPFTLLRLIPIAEASAISHIEGARHRVNQGLAAGGGTRMAAQWALRAARADPAPGGEPGTDTGTSNAHEAPGGDTGRGSATRSAMGGDAPGAVGSGAGGKVGVKSGATGGLHSPIGGGGATGGLGAAAGGTSSGGAAGAAGAVGAGGAAATGGAGAVVGAATGAARAAGGGIRQGFGMARLASETSARGYEGDDGHGGSSAYPGIPPWKGVPIDEEMLREIESGDYPEPPRGPSPLVWPGGSDAESDDESLGPQTVWEEDNELWMNGSSSTRERS